jgi:hypothetical protein
MTVGCFVQEAPAPTTVAAAAPAPADFRKVRRENPGARA